jgi:hypothetical protein
MVCPLGARSLQRLSLILVVSFFLAELLPAQQTSLSSEEVAAESIWKTFSAIQWSASYEDWKNHNSAAACVPYNPGFYTTGDMRDDWSYRCVSQKPRTEAYFFTLSPEDPPQARLEQVRISFSKPELQPLLAAHQILAQHFNQLFGQGKKPGLSLVELGSGYWKQTLEWQTQELQILLYLDEPRDARRSQQLIVLSRHKPLVEAMAEGRQKRERRMYERPDYEKQMISDLTAALRGSFPELPSLLDRENQKPDQAHIKTAAFSVLQSAQTAPAAQHPVLLLAADRIADRIFCEKEEADGCKPLREEMAAKGLTLELAELGGGWVYKHDLLWRVWKEAPETPWGEYAFLVLLRRGWSTSSVCADGSDRFREVIPKGEAYLASHPASKYRSEILLMVAQAYETWWSLSKATRGEDYADPASYREGAQQAREKALQYYAEIAKLAAPGSDAALSVRRHLPRLKLGVDTGQRAFFCIYD